MTAVQSCESSKPINVNGSDLLAPHHSPWNDLDCANTTCIRVRQGMRE